MPLSAAQKTAILGSLFGGGVSLLKDTIFPLKSKKKKKSWWDKILNASLYAAGGGALGYTANKAISKYLYNSLSKLPIGYPNTTEELKFLLAPKGNTFGEKAKDVWNRLTSTPDINSIKAPLDVDVLDAYGNISKNDIALGIAYTKRLDDKLKSEGKSLFPSVNNYDDLIDDRDLSTSWRFKSKLNHIIPLLNYGTTTSSVPYRRELLARNLGVFDDSKGSLYKEVKDISDVPYRLNSVSNGAFSLLRKSDSSIPSIEAFYNIMYDPDAGIADIHTPVGEPIDIDQKKAYDTYLKIRQSGSDPYATHYWRAKHPIYSRALAAVRGGNLYTADVWDFALNDGDKIINKDKSINFTNLARSLADNFISNKISIIDKQKLGIDPR